MASAVITAGGAGTRTAQYVPKQFLTVNDIPVIVYTMLNVQKNENIDRIVVVSPAGWENFIYLYAKQFEITKLKCVVEGGDTRIASIHNGLRYLKDMGEEGKVFLIDANRPLVPQNIINEVIALADSCDCSVGLEPCYDSMFVSVDGKTVDDVTDRAVLYRGVGPECGWHNVLLEIYESANIANAVDTSTAGLAIRLGKKVLATKGHIKCFKITTADDFDLFKAFLAAESLPNLVRGDEK